MSHELRTPLNHIIGFTELVVDKKLGELNDAQNEYLNDVLHSGNHLLSLINDILDLSKVEAGKMELEVTKIELEDLLSASLSMVKEKALKHGITLTLDCNGIPDVIEADERKLRQIIYNLLSNAVKFTPGGGKVSVSAKMMDSVVRAGLRKGDSKELRIIESRPEGNGMSETVVENCIQISVYDTSIGIQGKDQPRVFEPFEQV